MTRESDIEDYLCNSVKGIGGAVRKVRWIGRSGAPDRRVLHVMGCVWVELKAPGGKPEVHQYREHKRMRSYGELVQVISTFDEVDKFIGALLRGKYAKG